MVVWEDLIGWVEVVVVHDCDGWVDKTSHEGVEGSLLNPWRAFDALWGWDIDLWVLVARSLHDRRTLLVHGFKEWSHELGGGDIGRHNCIGESLIDEVSHVLGNERLGIGVGNVGSQII